MMAQECGSTSCTRQNKWLPFDCPVASVMILCRCCIGIKLIVRCEDM